MRKQIRYIIIFLMLCLSYVFYLQIKLNGKQQELISTSVWSHRGVHTTIQENTIDAYKLAQKQGFKGIEIDVFYEENVGFIVSHDLPYQKLNGHYLLLSEVLDTFDSDLFYWIDLKNLNSDNKQKIRETFLSLVEKYPTTKEKLFIESSNGWALRTLAKKELNCIFWVQFSRKQPKKFIKLLYLKTIIAHSKFKGISTDHRYIDQHVGKYFKKFNWYIFTVNDPNVIKNLKNLDETTVILTDLEGKYVFKN